MKLLLERDLEISGPDYTRGRLREVFAAGTDYETLSEPICFTIEDSQEEASGGCIPEGTYKAHKYESPHLEAIVWLLEGVPGRSYIEIHIANTRKDIKGCIGVGRQLYDFHGEPGVSQSATAFHQFMAFTKNETEIEIEVRWKKEAE